jgi:pseudouridine-5'-phosphate glycosidase
MTFIVAPHVAHALTDGRAVIALESTVIAHGLPYPHNVETALAMEAAIRDAGAVPATIAVLQGRVTVGLTADQIAWFGEQPSERIRKCSRRDLPIAVGLREDGATTVAGTMIAAHKAGIRLFATGGTGGVHRGAPMDISADLIELGRTPVAVICSGAKSILDLPLTLEVLETYGVPVIGCGTETLPAFYSRSSGLPVDVRVDTPEQAAAIVHALRDLEASHGILFCVPVPEAEALDAAIAERVIEEAVREAEATGIKGKAITPFVLSRVAALTGDDARRANIALLINNARTAAQIGVALMALERAGPNV